MNGLSRELRRGMKCSSDSCGPRYAAPNSDPFSRRDAEGTTSLQPEQNHCTYRGTSHPALAPRTLLALLCASASPRESGLFPSREALKPQTPSRAEAQRRRGKRTSGALLGRGRRSSDSVPTKTIQISGSGSSLRLCVSARECFSLRIIHGSRSGRNCPARTASD